MYACLLSGKKNQRYSSGDHISKRTASPKSKVTLEKYSFFSPTSEEKINVDRNKKSSKSFFWSKKEKNTPNKEENIDNVYNPKNFDLSEEAIERELEQIKKSKKKP